MLKIGFIGTRHGMTDDQKKEFERLIEAKEFEEFHHGMCRVLDGSHQGSDEQAHNIVRDKKSVTIVGHPPVFKASYLLVPCDKILPPATYSKRNNDIVNSTDCLIATPDAKERVGSGTWKTIRYARKKGKRIYIIHKNGRVTIE